MLFSIYLHLGHPSLLLASYFSLFFLRERDSTHLHVSASDSRRLESKQVANECSDPWHGST